MKKLYLFKYIFNVLVILFFCISKNAYSQDVDRLYEKIDIDNIDINIIEFFQ